MPTMNIRDVDFEVEFRWDVDTIPGTGGTWTDESNNVLSIKGALEATPQNESFQTGKQVIQKCTLRMANDGGRYSSYNTDSPLYPYLTNWNGYGVKVTIKLSTGSTYHPVFTGYVKTITENYGNNQVIIVLNDIGSFLRQKRSTTMHRCLLEHEAVILLLEEVGLVSGTDFVEWGNPGATIDWSTIIIDFVWLDDESIWDEIVDIASGSGGRVFVGPDGLVNFQKGYNWVLDNTGSVETVTIENIADFKPTLNDKAFFDEIVVDYTERIVGPPTEEVWAQQRTKLVLGGATEEFVARFKWPVVALVALDNEFDFFVSTLAGDDVSSLFELEVVEAYAQSADMQLDATTANELLVLQQGRLLGQPILGRPSEEVKRETANANFGRRLELRGNPYIQTKLQADAVLNFLSWWYNEVKQYFTVTSLPGDPLRILGRKITARIPTYDGTANLDSEGVVIRIYWQIKVSKTGVALYQQDLGCLQNVFDLPAGYFIFGTTTSYGTAELWH